MIETCGAGRHIDIEANAGLSTLLTDLIISRDRNTP